MRKFTCYLNGRSLMLWIVFGTMLVGRICHTWNQRIQKLLVALQLYPSPPIPLRIVLLTLSFPALTISNCQYKPQNPVLEYSHLCENYLNRGQVIQRIELKCSQLSLSYQAWNEMTVLMFTLFIFIWFKTNKYNSHRSIVQTPPLSQIPNEGLVKNACFYTILELN